MLLNQKINSKKLAKLLDVTPRTIRNWATDSVDPLPGMRIRGLWLFDVEKIDEWLERQNKITDVDSIFNDILEKLKKGGDIEQNKK